MITMEEILVAEDVKADLEVKEVVQLLEEKAEEMEVSEATEVRLQEKKADSEEKEVVRLQEEKADFLIEHRDVPKVLVIHQDQEDQEEARFFR